MYTESRPTFMRDIFSRAKGFLKTQTQPRLSKAKNSLHELDTDFVPDIPQASVLEEQLEQFLDKDWRKHFSHQLNGRGLEIGPLHRPLPTHEKMKVDYVDRHTTEELRRDYPELRDLPLVEPNIIDDAESLSTVGNGIYDFVVAAHVIEHMKNPLAAIENWIRVLKSGGMLYLIVPDKRETFDKQRVRTTLGHIVLDYLRPSKERDYEHYLDYSLHVQKAQWNTMIPEADRLADTDYSIHFHVFLPSDVINVLKWFSENISPIKIIEGPNMSPGSDEFHILVSKQSQ